MTKEKIISPFAKKIYQLLKQVPSGYVTTYADLARAANCKAYRAVGQVLRNNPFAPTVPCHRVLASDGSLHGFKGLRTKESLELKMQLLKEEGLIFEGKKLKNFSERKWRF